MSACSRWSLLAGLMALILTLASSACSGGAKARKNQYGAPALSAPAGGQGKAFVVPPNLIPPGAEPMKTDTGLSDRTYSAAKSPADLRAFFEGALKGASADSTREGQHITVRGGGWVIELYGGGEGENASTTIVYALAKELN